MAAVGGQTAGPRRLQIQSTYGPVPLDWVYSQKTFFFVVVFVFLVFGSAVDQTPGFATQEVLYYRATSPQNAELRQIYLYSRVHSSFIHCAGKAKQPE